MNENAESRKSLNLLSGSTLHSLHILYTTTLENRGNTQKKAEPFSGGKGKISTLPHRSHIYIVWS